jgi:predicted amidohydrolase
MRVALWACNLSSHIRDLDDWLRMVDARAQEAVRAGAEILLMPEYACMAWLHFKPKGHVEQEEISWMGKQVESARGQLQKIANDRKLAILPGTWPAKQAHGWVNRAELMFPDRKPLIQDKLHPIPTERDEDGWLIQPGEGFRTVAWRGQRIGIVICHDLQSEHLAKQIATKGIDLVLSPSMTEHEAGNMGRRAIFKSAKEHASKYHRVVCVVSAIGTEPLSDRKEPNIGGAAVYKGSSTLASIGPIANSVNTFGPMIIGIF